MSTRPMLISRQDPIRQSTASAGRHMWVHLSELVMSIILIFRRVEIRME